jgi:ribonucleotide reductase alpha subunit
VSQADMQTRYATYFPQCIKRGIAAELLDPELGRFDLERLGRALQARRDLQFNYLGLQTLYDRYFLHVGGRRIELPQAFFMRVAMGLALREKDREARAIEFYDVLSSFDFMSSTPTLFNAGTLRSQLSSCYLTTVSDDLEGIYGLLTGTSFVDGEQRQKIPERMEDEVDAAKTQLFEAIAGTGRPLIGQRGSVGDPPQLVLLAPLRVGAGS